MCRNPILKHNFICVSLDFEGLGTFERKSEHDILMALIGSGLGNNIILRMGLSFYKFTENFFEKLSEGSRKIRNINISQFFEGALCFSPKDVITNDKNNLFKELERNLEISTMNWKREEEDKRNKNNEIISCEIKNRNNYIFGLFKEWIWIPTPIIKDVEFYETLRKEINKLIIEDSLTFHRKPIYNTGKEFYNNLKVFLSAIYFNRFDFLGNNNEKGVEKYIEKFFEQAYEICGIINENKIGNKDLKDNIICEKNGLKFINNKILDNLEIQIVNNIKFENNNTLEFLLEDIKSLNIHGKKQIEKNELVVLLGEKTNDKYPIEIKKLLDNGLILKVPKIIYKELKREDLCEDFYKVWDEIGKNIGLSELDISKNFNNFIKSIIIRRNKNIIKWLKEITIYIPELRKRFCENDKLTNSSLDGLWEICNDKCKLCYNKCYLLKNHRREHTCFYDHICKEKCSICSISKCKEKNCNEKCIKEMSHYFFEIPHSCKHFHQCNKICDFNQYTTNCNGRCILEYGHGEIHFCGIKEHLCNIDCSQKNARKCKGKCCLIYPHQGIEHFCNGEHFCNEPCDLKEKSRGCKEYCIKEYNHKDKKHLCDGKHMCKMDCDSKLAKGCKGTCELKYGHKSTKHDCKGKHKCNEICIYKNISIKCNEKCCLNYNHKEEHSCGIEHHCNGICILKDKANNCEGHCILKLPHPNKEHICKSKHYCRNKCYYSGKSRNCKDYCILEYGHEGYCNCNLKENEHLCNKECSISSEECKRKCILPINHSGSCICGECGCPEECELSNCSRGCNKKCKYKAATMRQNIFAMQHIIAKRNVFI